MKNGKVYLIGAGPGDPGLITVKGLRCLEKADVVVYDYLANEELLRSLKAGAEKIYVGKKAADHTLSQAEINALIIRKAQEGKSVARLKGGDPFIFGRGGEEAEELAAAQIPIEIIPGVTSAIGAPAYAGIPLTHRDFTSTVAFITGHEDPEKEASRIDWEKISRGAGTLVFLMGVGNLPAIAEKLTANGRSPETPVALIRWGTLPEQETILGNLANIAEIARSREVKPPVIILVGEVVGLRRRLNWFETLPLFGRKILVTRSREQAGELAERLRELGALPLEFPTIEILPPADWADIDHCLAYLEMYDWIIFTSANGVRFFLGRLLTLGLDVRDIKGPRICAIGPGTADALARLRIRVDIVPSEYRAEAIVAALQKERLDRKRILIPRAKVARDVLPEELRKSGAFVDVVEVYQTRRPNENVEEIKSLLKNGGIDAITFTSSSTAANFAEMMGMDEVRNLTSGVTVASIGPITAEKARQLGMETQVMPVDYTIPALAEALGEYFKNKAGKTGKRENGEEGNL